jgi:hypothetical protein
MAKPIPRLAPEMNMVLAFKDMSVTVTLLTTGLNRRPGLRRRRRWKWIGNSEAIVAVERCEADTVGRSL